MSIGMCKKIELLKRTVCRLHTFMTSSILFFDHHYVSLESPSDCLKQSPGLLVHLTRNRGANAHYLHTKRSRGFLMQWFPKVFVFPYHAIRDYARWWRGERVWSRQLANNTCPIGTVAPSHPKMFVEPEKSLGERKAPQGKRCRLLTRQDDTNIHTHVLPLTSNIPLSLNAALT